MPKYVLKEDVQKGLVDPTRSLDEQPDYKKKIEARHQGKEKTQEQKPQRQRVKKERPPRKQRPKFNWNKNDVTIDTKVPEKPKKLIQKPDAHKHKEGFQKLKAEREALKGQRNAIFEEQRAVIKDINQSKKYGREVNTQYSGAMRQKMGWENQIRKQIRVLDDEKKRVHSEMDFLKSKVEHLRRPDSNQGFSIELIYHKIGEKEHQLTTAELNKREEAKLSNQINDLKRAIPGARSYIEIESDINKINDQIQILYNEVKPIKHELHVKITQANQIKAQIQELKGQLKTQKGTQEHKSIEQIKAEYDVKLKAVEQKRDKLEDRIDDYMDANTRAIDDYEDQQDLIRYIEWVQKQVEFAKKKKEEDERWEKEKEAREKKKLKEKEEWEARQEERKKKDEERKKRDEEYKARLEKEKEEFINRNPNFQTVDLCHALVDYCQSLKPIPTYEYDDPRSKNPGEIKFGKDWQKEIKKGAQVIISKKAKLEEQTNVAKKTQKPKKKQEKPEDEIFQHGIQIINQFQTIKLLPPNNPTEIDSTIKLINDKIEFYNNPSEEDKIAFKETSIRLWEQKRNNNNRGEPRKQGNYREKREERGDKGERTEGEGEPRKEKKEYARKGKAIKEGDFPELA